MPRLTLPEMTCLQGKVLVGGELAEPEGRLSKAQKKNMKRMEKKAAARASTDASVASSEVRCHTKRSTACTAVSVLSPSSHQPTDDHKTPLKNARLAITTCIHQRQRGLLQGAMPSYEAYSCLNVIPVAPFTTLITIATQLLMESANSMDGFFCCYNSQFCCDTLSAPITFTTEPLVGHDRVALNGCIRTARMGRRNQNAEGGCAVKACTGGSWQQLTGD